MKLKGWAFTLLSLKSEGRLRFESGRVPVIFL